MASAPQTPTERAVAAIAPDRSLEEITRQLREHPEKPVVLYLSGIETKDGAIALDADGKPIRCPSCVKFENEQLATLRKHKDSTTIVKHEIPLSIPAFQDMAKNLHANLDSKGILSDDSTHVREQAGTPMLLQLGLDSSGKLEIKAINGGSGNLDGWLTGLETTGRAQSQARAAVSGCQVESATSCKAEPVEIANLLQSLKPKTSGTHR